MELRLRRQTTNAMRLIETSPSHDDPLQQELKGFVTLLSEKGFPPPNGLDVETRLNGFALSSPRSFA
jgi:hypothetical protein